MASLDVSFQKSLCPFFCGQCGLVSVNIAKLPRGQVMTVCPSFQTPGCTQYGIPPVSLHDLRPVPWWKKFFKRSKSDATVSSAIQWGYREATADGHICPECREMKLRFSRFPSLMFD
jgi:predicted nucleotide-binding protein (sugar kinase/HSP70/actin superfamily)